MPPGLPVLTTSTLAALAAGLAFAGILVWWLIRRRQERVWLPTVRILDIDASRLPRIVTAVPPLFSFLCFLVAAIAVTVMTLKPHSLTLTPEEPRLLKIHVFVDLSPSVSAVATPFSIGKVVAGVYASTAGIGRVTLGTSHDATVHEPTTAEAVSEIISTLGIHRAGVRLGSSLKPQLTRLGAVDRLIVVSDRDQHSWSGFNWNWLTGEMDVVFVDLTAAPTSAQAGQANFLINGAQFLSTPSSLSMDWDVELLRRGTSSAGSGTLRVSWQGNVLATVPWQMTTGKARQVLRVSWPAMALADATAGGALGPDAALIWSIDVEGGDAISADNEFRTPVQGLKQDILLVAEAGGEQVLEDPAWQLQVVLEVLGFRVRRIDNLVQPGPDPKGWPLWILVGGGGKGVDAF